MPAGRKSKPTELKRLSGNPGKRPLNQYEPQPTGIPDCPDHLNAEAKAEWGRISQELTALGLLTNVDRAALGAYCAAYARWAEAEREIQKTALVVKAPKSGTPMQNPFIGIANVALTIMRQFLVEFGLTPSSRSRLTVNPATQQKPDPFAEFMESIGATSNDEEQPEG